MEWQPIETAPKDVEVLLSDGSTVLFGWWSDSEKGWQGENLGYDGDSGPFGATHWMPVPQPPSNA